MSARDAFQSIPERLRKPLRVVRTDMYDGFVNAAKEVFSRHVNIVVDRFHVAKLYRAGLDELRKTELKPLKKELPEADYQPLKGAMWALRRRPGNRTPGDVELDGCSTTPRRWKPPITPPGFRPTSSTTRSPNAAPATGSDAGSTWSRPAV
jgi:hypothetical protein